MATDAELKELFEKHGELISDLESSAASNAAKLERLKIIKMLKDSPAVLISGKGGAVELIQAMEDPEY